MGDDIEQGSAQAIRFCPRCGARRLPMANYCASCGLPLGSVALLDQPTPETDQAPAPASTATPVPASLPVPASAPASAPVSAPAWAAVSLVAATPTRPATAPPAPARTTATPVATDIAPPLMRTLALAVVVIVGAAAMMTLVLLIGSPGSGRGRPVSDAPAPIDAGSDARYVADQFWTANGTPAQHAYASGGGEMAARIVRDLDPLGRALRVTMVDRRRSASMTTMAFDVCTQPAGGPTKRLMADTTVGTVDGVPKVTDVRFTIEPVFADCDRPAPTLGARAFSSATPSPRPTSRPASSPGSSSSPILSGSAYLDCLLGPGDQGQTVDRALADCRTVQPPDWSDREACRVFDYTMYVTRGLTATDAEHRTEWDCARFPASH